MAAVLSRRGVTGVRNTKGLFFIFTLLCLVSFTSSLKELDKLREDLQRIQHEAEINKAHQKLDSEFIPQIMDNAVRLCNPLIEQLKELMPDFPPLLEFMECFKSFLEASKPYIHREVKKRTADMDNYEQKLKDLERLLRNLEESRAEL